MPDKIEHAIREIWESRPLTIRQISAELEGNYNIRLSRQGVHNRMKQMGLTAHGAPLARGYNVYCKDGHIVDSFEEARVDEFLDTLGIDHWVHYKILGASTKADFWLPEFKAIIEVAGVVGSKQYDERMKKKQEAYDYLNIPVVWVFPDTKLDAELLRSLRKAIEVRKERKKRDFELLSARNPDWDQASL